MSDFARLMPSRPVPPLRVKTVGGPCWRLCDQKPKHFTIILFYRGYHCDFCREQLQEVEARYDELRKLGVRVLAVSMDDRALAERTVEEWKLDQLTVCWGLTVEQARQWGLYISEGRDRLPDGQVEPAFFVEPAMFLVRPDGTLYCGMVQTMPLPRMRLDDILASIRYILATGLQPKGASEGFEDCAPCATPAAAAS